MGKSVRGKLRVVFRSSGSMAPGIDVFRWPPAGWPERGRPKSSILRNIVKDAALVLRSPDARDLPRSQRHEPARTRSARSDAARPGRRFLERIEPARPRARGAPG